MKSFMMAIMLWAGAVGCTNGGPDVVPLDGTYIGYFHRVGKDTARVTLHFDNNTYEGSSNKTAYPAIVSGSFRQSANTLSFVPPSGSTPAQDSSLALKGEYNYLYNDDGTVRIWKSGNEAEDEFILKVYLGQTVSHAAKAGIGTMSNTLQ
jgi:hypothetical protein